MAKGSFFSLFHKSNTTAAEAPEAPITDNPVEQQPETQAKPSLWHRLTAGLRKTSSAIGDGLWGIFKDKKIDDELFEELETQLLTADIGVPTTMKIVERLTRSEERRVGKECRSRW